MLSRISEDIHDRYKKMFPYQSLTRQVSAGWQDFHPVAVVSYGSGAGNPVAAAVGFAECPSQDEGYWLILASGIRTGNFQRQGLG